MLTLIKTATKYEFGIETTASMLAGDAGMFRVTVIHRFDSGNFMKEDPIENLSRVAAEGLLHFYTR